jgi:hypothetical protein
MPTFFARRDYQQANELSPVTAADAIQVADTNGDGILDVIVDEQGIWQVMGLTGIARPKPLRQSTKNTF